MLKVKYFTLVLVFVLVLATLVSVTGAGAAPKSDLSVSISADQTSFSASDAVILSVTISNNGKNSAKVLKWYTPAGEVEEPLFTVTREGTRVEYVGAHYKRATPTGSDYLTLKSGQSITSKVDLALYYDLSASGNYEIEYNTAATSLTSNKLNTAIEGRSSQPITEAASPLVVTGSTSFNKCTTSQQSSLITARTEASNYATSSLSYLTAGTQGPRYTTWFGIYNAGRYNTVKSHFTNIKSAMDTASVTFDCGCKKKNVYAYVYANQPYKIYLCGVFWTAPTTGTDSKAGTLIHETSHFTVVAGTDDWAYGQTAAKSLAINNPTNAIDNADSHEYFAENNPAQQ